MNPTEIRKIIVKESTNQKIQIDMLETYIISISPKFKSVETADTSGILNENNQCKVEVSSDNENIYN